MKHWIKRTLFLALGTSLVLGGLSACEHGPMHGDFAHSEADAGKMRDHIIDRAGRELALDEPQKQRLGVLLDKVHEQRTALVGGSAPRAPFAGLIAGPSFDRAGAQALVESKTDAVRAKSPAVIAAAGDFFDSLRPEQQQKVRDFLAKRHGGDHRS